MENKSVIKGKTFDEERALYNLKDAKVINCTFAGDTDGESVLKETRNISVKDCKFSLRYPLWHAKKFELIHSTFDDKTRAPIWYSDDGLIDNCKLDGIKLLRECDNILIKNTKIDSPEFGWKCNNISVYDTNIASEYIFLDSKNVKLKNVDFKGKYSFQYMEKLEIDDCKLDTKDAFWHSKNVVVKNSIIKGEYLAWFSENLTLINCKIIGTQPLCYCKNLRLIDCEMDDADLSFEYSEVDADIIGNVLSIKNPKFGTIIVDSVGQVINEDSVMDVKGKVIIRDKR